MIENKIRVISNWKPENKRESEAMRSLVMNEMGMRHQQPVNQRESVPGIPRDNHILGSSKNLK